MSNGLESISARIERAGASHFGSGWSPDILVRAPGRIEVIGNHVDYNGGPVLAAAIDREIHIAARKTSHAVGRAVFADRSEAGPFDLRPAELVDWRLREGNPRPVDYLRGVVASLLGRGVDVQPGLELVIAGNLPPGLGISSSAALCVGLTIALAESRPADREIVLMAQEAEHRVGSPCGTMDQSASVAGGLIAYSGADNSVSPLSADLGEHVFVVINSGVERGLASSAYPDRVRQSKEALAILQRVHNPGLAHLAQVRPADLGAIEQLLVEHGGSMLAARVRHVVRESERVRKAIAAVDQKDWTEVGRLMIESGVSSSTDYAISHPSVDEIVRVCLSVNGVLGARMMGGGEGGAALALIKRDAEDDLRLALDRDFFVPHGLAELAPRVVPCVFARGAGVVAGGI